MIKVENEIKTLNKVLLHRPGKELSYLTKDNMQEYLYDEIPDLKIAQKEHDIFANILRENGVEVYYLTDLMAEVLENIDAKEEFIKEYLNDQNCNLAEYYDELLAIKDNKQLVEYTMSGMDNKLMPMPNLYFTRDPFTIIGTGIALYHMHTKVRNNEVIYGKYINKYHKDFKLDVYYNRDEEYMIEGGDVLLLDENTIAIGQSERTTFDAAYKLAHNILNKDKKIKNILVMEIPSKRSCMHLDTVFTRFDTNKFVIFDEIRQVLKLKLITKDGVTDINDSLEETLKNLLKLDDIKIITCGNKNNEVLEQWNDACNTLCIAPNKFIVYDINKTTNEKYLNEGSTIYTIPSKELLKGRGGPHCMSMPLLRK